MRTELVDMVEAAMQVNLPVGSVRGDETDPGEVVELTSRPAKAEEQDRMSTRLTLGTMKIAFPPACMVCQQHASQTYEITRTISYGKRTVTASLPIPLCDTHHALAKTKNAAERLVGSIGAVLGAVAGLASAVALIRYWSSTGQGSLPLNLVLAGVSAIGFFLVIWFTAIVLVAPVFADAESRAVRRAVRIRHFWPARDHLCRFQ